MAEVDWKAAAVALFNEAWSYIDRDDRTPDDDRSMLAATLGSLACWRKVGTQENFSISDWQASRVYALLGDAPLARHYGESALEHAKAGQAGPFYTGFAYEALARAAAVEGNHSVARTHIAAATALAGKIRSEDDRALLDAALGEIEALLPGAHGSRG